LGAYIKKGADRLLQERARQFGYGTFRLLVVTDGEAQDQALVERFTPEVMARGITVDVIGVAMDQRHTLANRVHSYRAADDPQSLERALTEVLAEVRSTGNDAASAELFADLATIPDALAQAAIQALATSGNHPIGEAPSQPAPSSTPGSGSTAPGPGAAPAPSPPAPQGATAQSPPAPRSTVSLTLPGILGGLLCCGIIGVVFLVIVVKVTRRRPPRR
jgi:hypothetical protein